MTPIKVLILSPDNAERDSEAALIEQGCCVLVASSPTDASKLLQFHGRSIDLALIRKEPDGLEWVEQIRRSPAHSDLPYVVLTHTWSAAECATHQAGPQGANAYLRTEAGASVRREDLVSTLEAILGLGFGGHPKPPQATRMEEISLGGASLSSPEIQLGLQSQDASPGPVLEDATGFYGKSVENTGSIKLEVPVDLVKQEPEQTPSGEVMGRTGEIGLQGDRIEVVAYETPDKSVSVDLPGPEGFSQHVENVQEPIKKEAHTPANSIESLYALPVGDAVVPGGAAHAPDLETIKRYLMLREQDVAALSSQLRNAREQIKSLEEDLHASHASLEEVKNTNEEQRKKIDEYEKLQNASHDAYISEIKDLRFQVKTKTDNIRLLETALKEKADQLDRLKDRVKSDIQKIRVREKELENRLEILKKDSEVLIHARENRIIELKRKLDLVEFNMDLLQERYTREKEGANLLREKLDKAAQAMRVAGGFLDTPDTPSTDPKENKDREAS